MSKLLVTTWERVHTAMCFQTILIKLISWFSFFLTHLFPAARPKPRSLRRPCWPHAFAQAARAATRPVAGAAVQHESARTSCSSGSGLPPRHSPCSGSSSNDVAKARCAATERMPLQRCTQAPRAGTRRAGKPLHTTSMRLASCPAKPAAVSQAGTSKPCARR